MGFLRLTGGREWRTLRAALIAVLSLALVAPAAAAAKEARGAAVPRFVDETRSSGLDHREGGEFDFSVGGGAAVFDCDDDGLPDVYLAGGAEPAALFRNESAVGGPLRFSRIEGDTTDLDAVTGAYPLDIDSDGTTDLAVLRHGENVLLQGLGDCRFERANEAWSFDGGDDWTNAFSAKWESSATFPTLVFGDYVQLAEDLSISCPDNHLFRPAGGGSGYEPPVALSPGWCPLSMLFSDWDRSGRVDLRVSNDRHFYPIDVGEEQLWRVVPGEAPRAWTHDEGWQALQLWGMGIASTDLTGDGYPEYYLTSQGPNRLQTLADGPDRPTYGDISIQRGVTSTNPTDDRSLPSTSWHDQFEDVDNDGLVDLFISKGNVDAMPDFAMIDPSVLYIQQADGTFVDQAKEAGIQTKARGRGAALVDLNLDGLLDLVQSFRQDKARVWRNVGSGSTKRPRPLGDWLAVRLEQSAPNPEAIGAWVEVRVGDRVITREVTVGGGHAGGQLGWIHFGLGQVTGTGGADGIEVRVQWPDGKWGPWQPVEANGFAILARDAERPVPWSAPAGRRGGRS